jgi:hypothetical protein
VSPLHSRSRSRPPRAIRTESEKRIELLGLGVALLIAAANLVHFAPFITDDAFISLRYSRHLAEGHGIAWNVGEAPVEGYSNFLHIVLGAIATRLDVSPIGVLRSVGPLPGGPLHPARRPGARDRSRNGRA